MSFDTVMVLSHHLHVSTTHLFEFPRSATDESDGLVLPLGIQGQRGILDGSKKETQTSSSRATHV